MSLPKPYYEDDAVTLYNARCEDLLPKLGTGAVDAVLTDPPYNVGKKYGSHDDRMTAEEYRAWLAGVLSQCGQVSRDGVIWFPGTTNVFDVAQVALLAGVKPHRLLGWHKKEFAGDKWRGGPAMCWEPVVWGSVAETPFYNTIFGAYGRDFLVIPSTHGNPLAKLHPCPKPLKVMEWLTGLFCPRGGAVLDPFAGVGTTLLAAKVLGRRAIGVEVEEAFCEVAVRQLAQEVLPLEAS